MSIPTKFPIRPSELTQLNNHSANRYVLVTTREWSINVTLTLYRHAKVGTPECGSLPKQHAATARNLRTRSLFRVNSPLVLSVKCLRFYIQRINCSSKTHYSSLNVRDTLQFAVFTQMREWSRVSGFDSPNAGPAREQRVTWHVCFITRDSLFSNT